MKKEFLSIGATNYPNMIDPAILRAGRLDKKVLHRCTRYRSKGGVIQVVS